MEEEKQTIDEKVETEEEDTSSENLSIVDQAKRLHEQIKAENDRRENILKQEQKLHAERMLAGTGGGNVPKQKLDETPKEYKDRIMRGGK